MSELIPNLPEGSTILFNHFSEAEAPTYTVEDTFAVRLPGENGEYIDVGWYVEEGRSGEYVVQVFMEGREDPLEPPLAVRDVRQAVRVIELLAMEYAPATIASA